MSEEKGAPPRSGQDADLQSTQQDQAFDDEIYIDEEEAGFDWPEVEWELPRPPNDWLHDLSIDNDDRGVITDLLSKPGLIVVGRHPDDHEMASKWLHECLHLLSNPFEEFMVVDFESDDYLDEERLSAHFLREYQNGCDSDPEFGRGRILALANGPNLELSPDLRELRMSRLETFNMTILCFVDNSVFRKLGRDGVASHQLDTLDFAWRRVVHGILQDERHDVLNNTLKDVNDVLEDRGELLKAIRSQPDRRDDLREDVKRKLGSGDYDNPVDLCKDAIDISSQNGREGAANKRIMTYLGIGTKARSAIQAGDDDVPLSYAEMKKTMPKVVEPFATVIFMMWVCHQVQNDSIRETEFVGLLKTHLRLKRMAEEFKLAEQKDRAEAEEGDVQEYMEQIDTPARDLLNDGDDAIDSVLEVVKVQRFRSGRVPRLGYPHEIQGLLSSHLGKRRNYLAHQVRELHVALQPMRSQVPIVQRIGRMLFIHQAEEWGSMALATNRDAVAENLVTSMTADEQADVMEIAGVLSKLANVSDDVAVDSAQQYLRFKDHELNRNVGRQRRARARYVRELISDWYDRSLKELDEPEQIHSLRSNFSKLVTSLLKRLLERQDAPLQWYSLQLAEFTTHRPELIDLRAIARQTANRQSLAEIDAFMRCIGELDVTARNGHLERRSRGKGAVSRARLHYDAYRYVAAELFDEDTLRAKSVTYRWFVVALAYRILPGFFARLRQADYTQGASPEFSTDETMEQILADENGIETFVRTVLCSRMRDYPRQLTSAHEGLVAEHRSIMPEVLAEHVVEEAARLRFWIDHLWAVGLDDVDQLGDAPGTDSTPKVASKTDGAKAGTSLDGGAGDQPTIATRTGEIPKSEVQSNTKKDGENTAEDMDSESDVSSKPKPSPTWRVEIVAPATEADWEDCIEYTARISFHILQEFHEMLLCSGREAQAKRLIAEMKASGRKGDLREVKAATLWKVRNLKGLLKDIARSRRKLMRQKSANEHEIEKLDRLRDFTLDRLRCAGRFIDGYIARG